MAHMMSWPATLVAVVVGRPVGRLLAGLDVNGTNDSHDETWDVTLDDSREVVRGIVTVVEKVRLMEEEGCLLQTKHRRSTWECFKCPALLIRPPFRYLDLGC